MSDILYDAAVAYQNLQDVIYRITLGRKGNLYQINLHFPGESFYHLTGIQHLTDITFSSFNKERLYKMILQKKITIEDIKRSIYFEEYQIEDRLVRLRKLESMIESNAVTYRINPKVYRQYTTIQADYVCEINQESAVAYLFLVYEKMNPKFEDACRCCSFFKKIRVDFTRGTSKMTTLLIQKQRGEHVKELYRKSTYTE